MSRRDQDLSSAAKVFDLLWESLADVLGTAATATLLRRAIKRAAVQTSRPEPITVTRDGLDYEIPSPRDVEAARQQGSHRIVSGIGC